MRGAIGRRVGLTVFVVHLLYLASYIGDPMAASMLDLTVSLVERGRLDVDPYAGNSLDIARRGDHYYSGMPPGVSVAALPYYLVARPLLPLVATPRRERQVDDAFLRAGVDWRPSAKRLTILLLNLLLCALGTSVLAGWMAAAFHAVLGRLYPDLGGRARLVTTWLFAFGTLWFVYTPTLEHRVLSTSLCFAAFLALLDTSVAAKLRRAALCGLALGAAVATSYEVVLVAGCVFLFGLARWRGRWPWGWTIAAGAAVGLLLAGYHAACFGAPWKTPYGARAFALSAPVSFRRAPIWVGFSWREVADRVVNLLVGRRFGVFFYSPPLVLALPALGRLRRGDPLAGPAALGFGILAISLGFNLATRYDGTPGEFGSRFLLPPIPFLMLLVPASYRIRGVYRWGVPAAALAALVIVGKGVMFGAARDLSFWGNYPALLRRYGASNYTLTNLKDHVPAAASLGPLAFTAIHLGVLAVVLLIVRLAIWRPAKS